MFARNWLSLPAGLMWAMTRNAELTEKVQTDPVAYRNMGLRITIRLAFEGFFAKKPLPYFEDPNKAWLALRDFIADEKIEAEGDVIQRWGLHGIESHYPSAQLPSGEAGHLILLDNWKGFTETVLGPDETYRFHNGQGRYWKRVRLPATNLLALFPDNGTPKAKRKTGRKRDPLWEPCKREFMKLLDERGLPHSDDADELWRKQAHAEAWIQTWWTHHLPENGNLPAESNIRKNASEWLDEFAQVANRIR